MKKWYESKTVWFNFLAFVAVLLQAITGKEILNAGAQGVIMTVINMALRVITKHEINWSNGEDE